MSTELRPGTVVLVGGGPGDPGLMTISGMRALRQADVVVHDRLVPLECLEEVRPGAEVLDVGKIPRGHQTPQEEINRILVEKARQGHRVVRFKGGDNFVFGRGCEEWLACAAAGVPVEIIPGVTSAVAVPALAGIPVTHRSLTQGFTVVSGHVPPGDPRSTVDWDAVARTNTTLVILMGVKYLPEICARLLAAGLPADTPAAAVADGCTPRMTVVRAEVAELPTAVALADVQPPAITVIGGVVGLDLAGLVAGLPQAHEAHEAHAAHAGHAGEEAHEAHERAGDAPREREPVRG